MKIRNLVLMMTVALTTLSVSAQQTISDNFGQSLKISRFGTVDKFKNRNAQLFVHKHTYKICTCGKDPRCIEPTLTQSAAATLTVLFPRPGARLQPGESLKAMARIQVGGVKLTRRLQWLAGSSVVYVMETVEGDKTNVCSIEEKGMMLADSCSMPPPSQHTSAKCPPPTTYTPSWLYESIGSWEGQLVIYSIDLSRVATVAP